MKRFILGIVYLMSFMCFAHADTPAPTPPTIPVPRISIFSTTVDWQAITGLRLNEYHGVFEPDSKLIGSKGIVLYYLDAFPCYGLGDGVRVWMGPNNTHSGKLRVACVFAPETIMFSYRNAVRDSEDARNKGMLTCPVKSDGRELHIDMSRCNVGKDWSEYK